MLGYNRCLPGYGALKVGLTVALAAAALSAAIVASGLSIARSPRWTSTAFSTAFVFCLVLPKAGIKLHGVPAPASLVVLVPAILAVAFWTFARCPATAASPAAVIVFLWSGFVIARAVIANVSGVGLISLASWLIVPPVALVLVIRWRACGGKPSRRFVSSCIAGSWLLAIYAVMQLLLTAQAISIPGITLAAGDSLDAKPLAFQTLTGVTGTKYPSTYQNGNLVGAVAAVGAALALALATSPNGRGRPWSRALIPMAALVFLSGSRTAVLAFVAGAAVLAPRLLRRPRALRVMLLGAVSAVAVTAADAGLRSRFSLASLTDSAGAGRTRSWSLALRALDPTSLAFGTTSWGTGGVPLQEGWLGLLQQVGVVGVVLLCWFVSSQWRRTGAQGSWAAGAALVVCLVLDSSYLGYPVLLLALLFPVLLADQQDEPSDTWPTGASPRRLRLSTRQRCLNPKAR